MSGNERSSNAFGRVSHNQEQQSLFFTIDQTQEKKIQEFKLDPIIIQFNFLDHHEWFIQKILVNQELSDFSILKVTRSKIQFACKRKDQVLFGAASRLKINFDNNRKERFDNLKTLKSCADILSVGQYELKIKQEEDIKLKSQTFFVVECQSHWGNKFKEIISLNIFILNKLKFQKAGEKSKEIQFQPFCTLDKELKQNSQLLKHLLQKVLTLISEGEVIPFLGSTAIFYNSQMKCLEIIGVSNPKQKKYQVSGQVKNSEDATIAQILQIINENDIRDSMISLPKQYLSGEFLIKNLPLYESKPAFDISLLHQCSLPLFWPLYHSCSYNTMEISGQSFINYSPVLQLSLFKIFLYYSGQINSLNLKTHLPPLGYCNIFCFDEDTHLKIQELIKKEQNHLKQQNDQESRLSEIQKDLNQYFSPNFKTNKFILFQGYLENNLPQGPSKLRCFINRLRENESDPIFTYEIVGIFQNGILNGQGLISKINTEQISVPTYFDYMININQIPRHSMEDNLIIRDKFQYIYFDASVPGFEEGKQLQHLRSILLINENRTYTNKRKVYITISNLKEMQNDFYKCHLFLKTNPDSYHETHVYILSKKQNPSLQIELVQNIIWAFTENYKNNEQSAYISELNLLFSKDWSRIMLKSKLHPTKTKINNLIYRFEQLYEKEQYFIIHNLQIIDISHTSFEIFKIFQSQQSIIENRDSSQQLYPDTSSNLASSSASSSSSSSSISASERDIRLIAQHCEIKSADINFFFKQQKNLIELDISQSRFPNNILSELPDRILQSLKILNISETAHHYNQLSQFFGKKSTSLTKFCCKSLIIDGIPLFKSKEELFFVILRSNALKEVEYLDLSQNQKITDDHVVYMAENFYNLTKIRLGQCTSLSSQIHQHFYLKSNVRYLDFSLNSISFEFLLLPHLNYQNRSLKVVDFTNCTFINIEQLKKQIFKFLSSKLTKFKCSFSLIASQNFRYLYLLLDQSQIESLHCLLSDEFDNTNFQNSLQCIKIITTLKIYLTQLEKMKPSLFYQSLGTPKIEVFLNKCYLPFHSLMPIPSLSYFLEPFEILKNQSLVYLPFTGKICQSFEIEQNTNTLNLRGLQEQVRNSLTFINIANNDNIKSLISNEAEAFNNSFPRNLENIIVESTIILTNRLSSLISISAKTIIICEQDNNGLPKVGKLKKLEANNLSIIISKISKIEFDNITSILDIANISDKIALKFQLNNAEFQEKEQVDSMMNIFYRKCFNCKKISLEFKEVRIPKNLKIENFGEQIHISAMISNTQCTNLNLTIEKCDIPQFNIIQSKLPRNFIKLTLKLPLNKLVTQFISEQKNLKKLKLFTSSFSENLDWKILSHLPLTKVTLEYDISPLKYSFPDKVNKILVSRYNKLPNGGKVIIR